jgi:hypothetical protein
MVHGSNKQRRFEVTAWGVRRLTAMSVIVVAPLLSAACVTVRPEQRAVMADPSMQFDADPGDGAAREHVLENREGSTGGGSVKGGGCGCN